MAASCQEKYFYREALAQFSANFLLDSASPKGLQPIEEVNTANLNTPIC